MGLGETSDEAMRRELREELGLELEVGGLFLVAESLYQHGDEFRQDLNLCYPVIVPEGLDPEEPTRHPEEGHELVWEAFADLPGAGFRPAGLVPELDGLLPAAGGVVRHLVFGMPSTADTSQRLSAAVHNPERLSPGRSSAEHPSPERPGPERLSAERPDPR